MTDKTDTPPSPAGIRKLPVLGRVLDFVAPRRQAKPSKTRRILGWTSSLAAVLGLLMVLYPFAGQLYPGFIRWPVEKGIEWSNVLSDLEQNRIQNRLAGQIGSSDLANKLRSRSLAEGDPLTRIRIPKIGVDTIVVEGVSASALKAGAGHYPQTPLPGEKGNVSIAGHRTTYGRPFNRIDELGPGDKIYLQTPIGRFTYQVSRDPFIVSPEDVSVIGASPDALLTLTSCNPKGSARQRIIVRAKLVPSKKAASPTTAARPKAA